MHSSFNGRETPFMSYEAATPIPIIVILLYQMVLVEDNLFHL